LDFLPPFYFFLFVLIYDIPKWIQVLKDSGGIRSKLEWREKIRQQMSLGGRQMTGKTNAGLCFLIGRFSGLWGACLTSFAAGDAMYTSFTEFQWL